MRVYSIRLPQQLQSALGKEAKRRGLLESELIRWILRDWLGVGKHRGHYLVSGKPFNIPRPTHGGKHTTSKKSVG